MAVIYAKYGQEKDLANLLLGLADDVLHVRTNTDNGLAFLVPEYLYERYLESFEEPEPTLADVEQVKRRPGRPRKSVPAPAETEDE